MVALNPIHVSSATIATYRKPIIKLFSLFFSSSRTSILRLWKKKNGKSCRKNFPFKPIHTLKILSIHGEPVGTPQCVWQLE
jgi:hypothetical protein